MEVPSGILIFIRVLRITYLIELPLSSNISCRLKTISQVMEIKTYCFRNTLSKDSNMIHLSFWSAFCQLWYVSLSSYVECRGTRTKIMSYLFWLLWCKNYIQVFFPIHIVWCNKLISSNNEINWIIWHDFCDRKLNHALINWVFTIKQL